jgi:hypothetical protein
MGTSADEVVDIFMMNIQNDYVLNNVFATSGSSALVNRVEPWLLTAIDAFDRVSIEDLTYAVGSGSAVGYFTATLSRRAINILARCMVKNWLQQQVSNMIAMSRYVVDRDFRMSAPNLPSLQNYLTLVTEEIDQLLGNYAYDKDIDWDSWNNQIFTTLNN